MSEFGSGDQFEQQLREHCESMEKRVNEERAIREYDDSKEAEMAAGVMDAIIADPKRFMPLWLHVIAPKWFRRKLSDYAVNLARERRAYIEAFRAAHPCQCPACKRMRNEQ